MHTWLTGTALTAGCIASLLLVGEGVAADSTSLVDHQDFTEVVCIDFQDVDDGTEYLVSGDVTTFSGFKAEFVEYFKRRVGAVISDGTARIENGIYYDDDLGSGNRLATQNINLVLYLPPSAYRITVDYADYALVFAPRYGDTSLRINGLDHRIPGIHVTMEEERRGSYFRGRIEATELGSVLLEDDQLETLTIGGSELFLDDICIHCEHPEARELIDALNAIKTLLAADRITDNVASATIADLQQRLDALPPRGGVLTLRARWISPIQRIAGFGIQKDAPRSRRRVTNDR